MTISRPFIKSSRFKYLSVDEILAMHDPKWVVSNFLPANSLAQLYGESGLGKTFIALDMALSVAAGIKWLGTHEVEQGPVVYMAGEGHHGMKLRIASWLDYHKLDPSVLGDFRLIGEALPLANFSDVSALIRENSEVFPERSLSLMVLDTQARCTEGMDENSAQDMGRAISSADRLKRSMGGSVLLLHHTGYQTSHARGSTVVHAALDTQVVLKGERYSLSLTCTKQKDAEEFKAIPIGLKQVGESLVAVGKYSKYPSP